MRHAPLPILALSLIVSSCSGSSTSPTSTITPSIFFSGGSSTGGSFFAVGQTGQLTATERLADKSNQDVTSIATWQSSNPSVATVSNGGLVAAVAVGTTIITASTQGTTGSLAVSVAANTVTSIQVVASTPLQMGQSDQLVAVVSTTSGMDQFVTSGVSWQSANPGVATVSSTGLLTAVAPGRTTITATYGGVSGSAAIKVVNQTVTSIVFYGNTVIAASSTAQLTASAMFADGSSQIVTNLATWQSSNIAMATVSSTGLVTWVATGTATITATYLGTSGSVVVVTN